MTILKHTYTQSLYTIDNVCQTKTSMEKTNGTTGEYTQNQKSGVKNSSNKTAKKNISLIAFNWLQYFIFH